MNRTLFRSLLSILFLLTALVGRSFAQRTSPVTDTSRAKPADTSKPVFTLKTLNIAPVYQFSIHDNAAIDSSKQFRGAVLLPDSCYYRGETHLKNIRQLTSEGVNTGAALSADDKFLAFEARGTNVASCDQIYMMPLAGNYVKRISNGEGGCSSPYFLPDGAHLLFSSTMAVGPGCPRLDYAHGWPLFKGYDLYVADTSGTLRGRLTNDTMYDGEPAVSPLGDRIVFTSTRSGDPELFTMNTDGSDVQQLTHEPGYHGGARYSPDGKQILFCAARIEAKDLPEYRKLLAQGSVHPTELEIYVMDSDGSHVHPVTHFHAMSGQAAWAPDGEHIVFSSNELDPNGQNFDLFMVDKDGSGIDRITDGGGFNGFPMFTHDGSKLVFVSCRNGSHSQNMNLFIADWRP